MLTTLYNPMHQRSNRICPEKPFTNANQSWGQDRQYILQKRKSNQSMKKTGENKKDIKNKEISVMLGTFGQHQKLRQRSNTHKHTYANTQIHLLVHPPQCLYYRDKYSLWTLTFKSPLCWNQILTKTPKTQTDVLIRQSHSKNIETSKHFNVKTSSHNTHTQSSGWRYVWWGNRSTPAAILWGGDGTADKCSTGQIGDPVSKAHTQPTTHTHL